MRKSIYTLVLACTLATTGTAQAQSDRQAEKARTEQAVQKALDERRFCIDVNYMNPMRGRGRALTSPYSLTVRNDSVLSYLPYVGQAYSVPYDGRENGDARTSSSPPRTTKTPIYIHSPSSPTVRQASTCSPHAANPSPSTEKW